jgi:hypothetical protein
MLQLDNSLQLGGNDGEIIKLFAFSDASYVIDKDARSQLGNCFFLTRDRVLYIQLVIIRRIILFHIRQPKQKLKQQIYVQKQFCNYERLMLKELVLE